MIKLFFLIMAFVGVCIYFIPALVAIARRHAHVLQITILNAFLGWMFPVWVASLIWSTTKNTDEFIETKGAWVTIGVFALLVSMPLLTFSLMPQKFKTDTKEEIHYKKVIYTTDIDTESGKVIRKVIEIKKDED